jgi:hypothetical protein
MLNHKPDRDACERILRDSLAAIAVHWPNVERLLNSRKFVEAIEVSVGLDGRQIRKAVIGACAFSKETAMDPNRLEIDDVVHSLNSIRKKMTTVVARRFASTPQRTAVETWTNITALLAPAGTEVRRELQSVAGIAGSVIASELPEKYPSVMKGNGPRLRIYC